MTLINNLLLDVFASFDCGALTNEGLVLLVEVLLHDLRSDVPIVQRLLMKSQPCYSTKTVEYLMFV